MGNPLPSRFSKFKRLQFSLRTMLVVTTVLILLLVFWVIPSERQRIAVNQIEKLGGIWKFSGDEITGWPFSGNNKSSSSSWFSHYIKHVDQAFLQQAYVSSVDWESLKNLRVIHFNHATIDDQAAIKIGKIKSGRVLKLEACELSDEGLFNITRSTALNELNIDGQRFDSMLRQRFTKVAFEERSTYLRDLKKLNAAHPSWLSDLKEIQKLQIDLCSIDSKILTQITQLKKLKSLNVQFTALSDLDPKLFGQLQSLEQFNLCTGNITDEIIEEISSLPHLRQIVFSDGLSPNRIAILARSKSITDVEYISDVNPEVIHALVKFENLKRLKLDVPTNFIPPNPGRKLSKINLKQKREAEKVIQEIKQRHPDAKIITHLDKDEYSKSFFE